MNRLRSAMMIVYEDGNAATGTTELERAATFVDQLSKLPSGDSAVRAFAFEIAQSMRRRCEVIETRRNRAKVRSATSGR